MYWTAPQAGLPTGGSGKAADDGHRLLKSKDDEEEKEDAEYKEEEEDEDEDEEEGIRIDGRGGKEAGAGCYD